MSAPYIIIDCLPSLCQKLSDLVEVWSSYNKNNFAGWSAISQLLTCQFYKYQLNVQMLMKWITTTNNMKLRQIVWLA